MENSSTQRVNIRWTEKATACLESISACIAEDNPEAALRTVTKVFKRIEQLSVFPNRGRLGREEGTREVSDFCVALPCGVWRPLSHRRILYIPARLTKQEALRFNSSASAAKARKRRRPGARRIWA